MRISLDQISKKFQHHWIFKQITYSFVQSGTYALLGSNGSGKSTLLRIIAGMQSSSLGKIVYEAEGKNIEAIDVFPYISFCAPGMDIVEELTLKEFLTFHFSFKKMIPGMSVEDIISLAGLGSASDKALTDFSSGMKQRVKLAQAIFSNTPTLLLDEPCTNLDDEGVSQYRSWIAAYCKNRLIIVASNDTREYSFCQERLDVEAYK